MGQALYRKYRSKNLEELVGQQHITDTLKQAIKQGRISHAYLFTGPRGIGKTSTARILAHAINDLPYDEAQNHLDIIEIDAASNRRIDEIRDIRDRVYIAPAQAKYKVYIIDEVHMLTKEAFNALLKTLEEPPAHVVFILATTEAYKLPATIISRTQRYVFRPADRQAVAGHLRTIATQEKIEVNDEALLLIADYGQGSFRDSISLLDQAATSGQAIDEATIQQLLGIAPATAIKDLWAAVAQGDKLTAVSQLQTLYDNGHNASQLATQLAAELRQSLLDDRLTVAADIALTTLDGLLEVPASPQPERSLELVLLAAALQIAPSTPVARPTPPPTALPKQPVAVATPVAQAAPVVTPPPAVAAQPAAEEISGGADLFDLALWPSVLEAFRQRYNTLYSILSKSQATIVEGTLELCVDFPFHQKRLNENKNKQIIFDVIKQTTGLDVSFRCTVKPKVAMPPAAMVAKTPDEPDAMKNVNNIFGGGEVLS